jgi:hypothetical protein
MMQVEDYMHDLERSIILMHAECGNANFVQLTGTSQEQPSLPSCHAARPFSLHSNQSARDGIVRSMMEALVRKACVEALAKDTLTFIGSHASINGRQRMALHVARTIYTVQGRVKAPVWRAQGLEASRKDWERVVQ